METPIYLFRFLSRNLEWNLSRMIERRFVASSQKRIAIPHSDLFAAHKPSLRDRLFLFQGLTYLE